MKILYKNKKLEKQCTDLKVAKKEVGDKIGRRLLKAINFINEAPNLSLIIDFRPLHFHDLKADRKGQYAIDIGTRRDGYRLILEFDEEDVFVNAIYIEDIYIAEMGKHYE